MDGKLSPPVHDFTETSSDSFTDRRIVGCFGRNPHLRAETEELFHQQDELIGAMVADGVFGALKQVVVGIKSDDVPRVNNGAALDGPF